MRLILFCLLYISVHILKACLLHRADSSGRSYLPLQTFGDKIYINIKQRLNIEDSTNVLLFKLRACADGFITLSTYSSKDDGPFIQIIIGGWGNTKSQIENQISKDIHMGVLLDCHIYKPFWLHWADGYIKLGRGFVPLDDEILQLEDERLNSTHLFRYIGITSHWSHKAQWLFNMTDKTDTTTDKNCTESSKGKDNSWCWPINPCLNNGKCLSNETSYNCYCEETLEMFGAHCEKQFITCETNPCQNGGKCQYRLSEHNICDCGPGYKGNTCNIAKKNHPHWKEAFTKHHNWSGIYYYANQRIPFSLYVNQLVYGPDHMMLATLTDNDIVLEMRGFSLDDIYVTFELSSILKVGSKLNLNSDIVMSGLLISKHHSGGWEYRGKVTLPDNNKFGAFRLNSKEEKATSTDGNKLSSVAPESNADLNIGLGLGLGLGFGILIATVTVIGLTFYLRHGCRRQITTSDHTINYNRMEEPPTTIFSLYKSEP